MLLSSSGRTRDIFRPERDFNLSQQLLLLRSCLSTAGDCNFRRSPFVSSHSLTFQPTNKSLRFYQIERAVSEQTGFPFITRSVFCLQELTRFSLRIDRSDQPALSKCKHRPLFTKVWGPQKILIKQQKNTLLFRGFARESLQPYYASSIGGMDRSILFICANRFNGIETGF